MYITCPTQSGSSQEFDRWERYAHRQAQEG